MAWPHDRLPKYFDFDEELDSLLKKAGAQAITVEKYVSTNTGTIYEVNFIIYD